MGNPLRRDSQQLASRDGLVLHLFGRWSRLRSVLECLNEGCPRRIWCCVLCDKCSDLGGHDLANVV